MVDASLGQCSRQSRPPVSRARRAVRLVCDDRGQGQGGSRRGGKGGGGQDHRLPQSDYAFGERAGPNIPLLLKGTSHGVAYIWCAILVGLGNESHVAGACPRCVVGGGGNCGRGPGGAGPASHSRPTTQHAPYVNGDTQTQSCLLCKSGAALPSPPPRPRDAKPADGHGG